jgi:glucokinase
MRVIAADVGGTNVRLALVEVEGSDRMRFSAERTYAARQLGCFEEALGDFIAQIGGAVDRACFACAGPVGEGVCRTTNLPWVLDERVIARKSGIARVTLLNDFQGAALGIAHVPPEGLVALGEPAPQPAGAPPHRVLLGAGTGLGEALLVHDGKGGWIIVPSEGGHADFAARDAVEDRLLAFLRGRHGGHVSYERVVSGAGLREIYEFLCLGEGMPRSPAVEQAAGAEGDVPAAISEAADAHPTCDRALEIFCGVYGAEASNLALKVLAYGGVFVAGGIAPKILPRLRRTFRPAFLDKGRYRELLERCPIHVVTDGRLALRGAASAAFVG